MIPLISTQARRLGWAAGVALMFGWPLAARAGYFDLSLRGLGVPTTSDASPIERYRLLTTELAFAIAPRANALAETLGLSGFELAADVAFVSIHADRDYWRGTTAPITEGAQHGRGAPQAPLSVAGFHLRKGLPFSFEIGAHLNYVMASNMFALGAELRWALVEGYRYSPDLAFRAAASRLLGAGDIDMTTLEVSATVSKTFAVAGVMTLAPYAGWGWLFANVNSAVLDKTPASAKDNEALSQGGSLYTLPELSLVTNNHHRFFGGLRIHAYVFEIFYQIDLGFISRGPLLMTNSVKAGLEF